MTEIYLDNAATTRCDEEAAELIKQILTADYGNPSSAHKKGFDAERLLREAAERVAKTLKCGTKELIFTSGGTEADNLALYGAAQALKRRGKRIITSATEHPAVLETVKRLKEEGFDTVILPVDGEGILDMDALKEALTDDTILVSVMAVNNETGSVQPLAEIGKTVKEKCPEALFHTDAVQGYGKIPVDVRKMKIDMLSVSAHKLHGPKGTGFLYVRDGVRLIPQITGGGQQAGLRSGTENVPGICGMALACEKACSQLDEVSRRLYAMRAFFCDEAEKHLSDIQINGPAQNRLMQNAETEKTAPHIISLSVRGVPAEVMLHALEERGIYISAGSACSSHHDTVSGTLAAMDIGNEDAKSTLRISMSSYTTREELTEALRALEELTPKLRKYKAS